LDNFVSGGGSVLVTGVNRFGLQEYESSFITISDQNDPGEGNLLSEFFQFLGVEPLNWGQTTHKGFPYMREQDLTEFNKRMSQTDLSEQLNLTRQEGVSYSNPNTRSRWGWSEQWNGIDYLLLSDPMPISVNTVGGSSTTIATLENMVVLVNDILLIDNYGIVDKSSVAAVRQKGQGYIGTVSAHLISDHLIGRAPANVAWTIKLIDLMVAESKKNVLIRSDTFRTSKPQKDSSKDWFQPVSDVQLAEMILEEENIYLEYKSSFIGGKESQSEIMDQICAFANTSGGTILVGISDSSEILGIDDEIKKVGGRDEYRKRITGIAGRSFLPQSADLFRTYFISVKGKTVLQIGIRDSGTEVIYRKREDGPMLDCWIRTNAGKQRLDVYSAVSLAEQKRSKK
jgi:hypothetical protein